MPKTYTIYTEEDCTDENPYEVDLEGRIVIIEPSFFNETYRDCKYQIVQCTGGFGCSPNATGNAIYVKELLENGESYRIERRNRNILGFPKDSVLAEYKQKYLGE